MHLDKALSVPSGFEPPHASLPLTRRLMRVLGPIVQVPVLSVSNARHHDPFRGGIAAQLVRYNHAGRTREGRSSLRKDRMAANQSRLGWTRMSITTPF